MRGLLYIQNGARREVIKVYRTIYTKCTIMEQSYAFWRED